MTLTLHARVATNSQMNEPNRRKRMPWKKNGVCVCVFVRLYRKFLLHLLLLNEPICSDTHKLNNLRVKRSEQKLRNKRPSKAKTWYSLTHTQSALSHRRAEMKIMVMFTYASFALAFMVYTQCRSSVCIKKRAHRTTSVTKSETELKSKTVCNKF